MKIVPIVNLYLHRIPINSIIEVQGWIRSKRDSKSGISFLNVYDGSCFNSIQVVVSRDLVNYAEVLRLTAGCSISIVGCLILSPGEKQNYEIQATVVEVIGWIEDPKSYPVSAKKHTVEYLRDIAHLRPRTNFIGAITRIRHTLVKALHNFFDKKGYYLISTPIITEINAEGAGEMFRVSTKDMKNISKNVNFDKDFFGKESFLTVSGQLTLETYACALSKVYSFGPVFRAENSNTSRHLAEFWMLEVEKSFSTLKDMHLLSEEMLKYIISVVLKECELEILFFKTSYEPNILNRLRSFLENDFVKIDYKDAIEILLSSKIKFQRSVFMGVNLSTDHERYIVEKYFKKPVIISNYPKDIKAFYMRLNKDQKTVAGMDILLPGIGEIIGGSEREERLEILDNRLIELGLEKENYWWYRDLRRYGTVPHAGFGLGIERLIVYITGIKNIRDVIPFPRTVGHANF
ncbi:asparagine--tRNA ligase [Buchnera aphidicola (Pemphigus obesinymphae)]|uniref:asparagine--tRNA ligase n=1 Tax=Buchnera aphidicola TaxID=9 RepID=UPI002238A46C|nr:asparagine--tRNA ligase [Buchnera aphidicola]MCW5196595.1 asparagine--tRNA ligase [Buchnera aphidicola (Pemphigus obesinymphae)]